MPFPLALLLAWLAWGAGAGGLGAWAAKQPIWGQRRAWAKAQVPAPAYPSRGINKDLYYDILKNLVEYERATSTQYSEDAALAELTKADALLSQGYMGPALPRYDIIRKKYPELFEEAPTPWGVQYGTQQYTPEQWQMVGRDIWGLDIEKQQQALAAQKQTAQIRERELWQRFMGRSAAMQEYGWMPQQPNRQLLEQRVGELTGEKPGDLYKRYIMEGQ